MVSMKEIAKKCNVSVATVSKALNGYLPDIGQERQESYIRENGVGDGIPPELGGKSPEDEADQYNLGVLFADDSQNSGLTHALFLPEFWRAVKAVLRRHRGYDVTFTSRTCLPAEERCLTLEHCRYRGVDGVVMACVDFTADPEVSGAGSLQPFRP